jgi:hypothetical protein
MDPWDEQERVRPIPIGDEREQGSDAGWASVDEDGATTRERTRPPWLPLLIASVAVAIVAATLTVYGALRFDEPGDDTAAFRPIGEDEGDSTTTSAAVLAPRLEELLPGLVDRLTLVAVRDDMAWSLLWDPSFREPKAVPLDLESTPAARISGASFDRGAGHLAVESCGALACDVWIGSSTDLGRAPDIEGALSYTWHAIEVGRIAWVAPVGESEYAVFTGTVNPLSGTIEDAAEAFSIQMPAQLVQWDSFGFVLGTQVNGVETLATGASGELLWASEGLATSGTDSVVAIVDDEGGWTLVDRTTGGALETASSGQLVFVTTSDSADLVARLTEREQGYYSLTVTGGGLSAPRIVTIEERYVPIGFTDDGAYFLFSGGDETIIFVNWNQGFAREVRVPSGYRIIGLDVG